MPNNINIIVLCAGKSSRMGLNIPKVALTINGVSLIENTLKNLQKLNPEKIILVVGFKKNLVCTPLDPGERPFKLVKFPSG